MDNKLNFSTYSTKSFVVTGDTRSWANSLHSFGGKFNNYLNSDNGKFAGYIFSMKRENEVKRFIEGVNSGKINPDVLSVDKSTVSLTGKIYSLDEYQEYKVSVIRPEIGQKIEIITSAQTLQGQVTTILKEENGIIFEFAASLQGGSDNVRIVILGNRWTIWNWSLYHDIKFICENISK